MQAPPPEPPPGAPRSGLRHGLFPRNPLRHLRLSDLRGLAQIATLAGVEMARVAEELEAAWRPVLRDATGMAPPPAPAVPPRGDPRLDPATNPYGGLRGLVRLSGQGLDALLASADPWLEASGLQPAETPERVAVLAAMMSVNSVPTVSVDRCSPLRR